MSSQRVTTDGIVLRGFSVGISSGPHTTEWRAHTAGCRYAKGGLLYPMAEMIEAYGLDTIRGMIITGSVHACGVCKPDLLIDGA